MLARVTSTLSGIAECLRTSRRSAWLGVVSFEERSLASIDSMLNHALTTTLGIAISYEADVRPSAKAEGERSKNVERLKDIGSRMWPDGVALQRMLPYTFYDLDSLIHRVVEEEDLDLLVLDVSCLTKIHALALAGALPQIPRTCRWILAYTFPENYGYEAEGWQPYGWRDILVAPLNDEAALFNEVDGRGVIIPGHEPDRLIVALGEMRPSGGVVVFGDTPKRPDLRRISERLNRKVLGQLLDRADTRWVRRVVGTNDLTTLSRIVASEVGTAKDRKAPLILFPYGPKPLIIFAAMQMYLEYGEASWFVYPVPVGYDARYSDGIDRTFWFQAP